MRLPNVQKILRQDVADAPDWIVKVIEPFNQFFQEIYIGLSKDITFSENIASKILQVSFKTLSTYPGVFSPISLPHQLRTVPEGVMIMRITLEATNYTPITSAVSLDWEPLSQNVRINHVSGLTPSRSYTMKILII